MRLAGALTTRTSLIVAMQNYTTMRKKTMMKTNDAEKYGELLDELNSLSAALQSGMDLLDGMPPDIEEVDIIHNGVMYRIERDGISHDFLN